MRTSNQHLFSQVPQANIPRSSFDRTHTYKTAFDSGKLVPFFIDEVLPGDTFNCDCNFFARMTTPVVPIMDNLYLESFFFFVPSRLVWDNFEKFMGERENPNDSIDYLMPVLENSTTGVEVGSLYDYMGIRPSMPINQQYNPIQSLPMRAYNLIWNEWFRDENLQDSVNVPKGDGPDPLSTFKLLNRNKRHDYYTSSLPFSQKGPGQGIVINLGDTAPITGSIIQPQQVLWANQLRLGTDSSNLFNLQQFAHPNNDPEFPNDNTRILGFEGDSGTTASSASLRVNIPSQNLVANLNADLSLATAISINDLRTAFQLQKLLEKDALYGTRYREVLLGHFGVVSPDARLQRPEYLGGSSARITIKPVEQTSATDTTSPQGNLAAYGVVGDSFHGFSKSFVEHGYIIGLMNVRADLTYQHGLNRMWSRRDRYDHYWPVLAHLGEQAVLNREIFMTGTATDDDVFGYQERYAEYRYKPSLITGKLRSGVDGTLDIWHLAQDFESTPQLNSEFISENVPLARSLAIQNEPQFIFDSQIRLKCTRPMPVYSIPGFVDHF